MIEFKCGCTFEVDDNGMVLVDIEKVTENCKATWDLICSGNTLGVFQLEKQLGQTWAKRFKPRNTEDLAILVSILRPGCLESGMAEKIVKIRKGEEETSYLVPELEPILRPTLSCLVYQEQAILIGSALAGFDHVQADILRKAMGKKKADIMAEVKKTFLDGCKEAGILDEKQATEVFSWIQESERYSFNKSHAVCYGKQGYRSAYCKEHFGLNFFKSYLKYAKDKINPQEEIRNLVKNAKATNVDICVPSVLNMNKNFIIKDKKVYFGLTDIKGVGDAVIKKLNKTLDQIDKKYGLQLDKMSWFDILCLVSPNVNSNAFKALIKSGAFGHLKKHRRYMEYEYSKFTQLTDKEKTGIIEQRENFEKLYDALVALGKPKKEGGVAANKNRVEIMQGIVKLLDNPSYALCDEIGSVVRNEVETLGVPLSYHMVQSRDDKQATHTCYELNNNKRFIKNASVAISIDRYKEHKIKRGNNVGKEMAFLTISDKTDAMENVVIFPDAWNSYKDFVIEGNTVILVGNKKDKDNSFIVNEIHQI